VSQRPSPDMTPDEPRVPPDDTPAARSTELSTEPSAQETAQQTAHQSVSARAFAELSAIDLTEHPVGAVLRRIAELAVKMIPGIDEASVTLIERGRPRTVAFTGPLAVTLDERQYEAGFGPCLDAARHGQTILVDTRTEDTIYVDFARLARRQGIKHVLSIGMPALQQTSGGINVYSAAEALDEATIDTTTTLAGHAAVTLYNAAFYAGAQEEVAQMKQAMASRAQIEQAKGVIMREYRCSPEKAFAILVELSSHANRKLRDVAASIIADATST
jgi:GAF domain-containing protein